MSYKLETRDRCVAMLDRGVPMVVVSRVMGVGMKTLKNWKELCERPPADVLDATKGAGKLRSCPFCGKARGLLIESAAVVGFFTDDVPDGSLSTWHVRCGSCGALGPETMVSRTDAAKAWNERSGGK